MSRRLALSWALCLGLGALAERAHAQCDDNTCLSAGIKPGTVSSSTGNLLDAVLSSVLGVTLDLSEGQYGALAGLDLSIGELLDALAVQLSLTTPGEVLAADLTIEQLLDAAASVAAAGGNATASVALTAAADDAAALLGTIRLGDLLSLDLRAEVLDVCAIGALDLLTSAATLFNSEHATSVVNVSVLGSALGLGSLIDGVSIAVVALEPPALSCGAQGSMLSASGLRVRTRIDLVETAQPINVAGLASASLGLAQLDLVTELSAGLGTLALIDALAGTLRVDATPGITSLYLGTISDARLLDGAPIDPDTDLGFANVAQLDVTLLGGLIRAAAAVSARGHVTADAPAETMLAFGAPYPTALTAEAEADLAGTLATGLLANLEVQVGALMPNVALLPAVLNALLAGVVNTLGQTTGVLAPVLEGVLGGLVDPLLGVLGAGLGEISVRVCAPFLTPSGASCDDGAFCTAVDGCDGAGQCTGSGSPCAADALACTTASCDEASDACSQVITTGCVIAGACVAEGARDPSDACRLCEPADSRTEYSTDPDPLCGEDASLDASHDAGDALDASGMTDASDMTDAAVPPDDAGEPDASDAPDASEPADDAAVDDAAVDDAGGDAGSPPDAGPMTPLDAGDARDAATEEGAPAPPRRFVLQGGGCAIATPAAGSHADWVGLGVLLGVIAVRRLRRLRRFGAFG